MDHYLRFWRWADIHQTIGVDMNGNPVKYVPYDALKEYWTSDKINAILADGNRPQSISNDDILERLLRIFSTLVYISRDPPFSVRYIEYFYKEKIDDERCPLSEASPVFPGSPSAQITFQHFYKNQFLFMPARFGPSAMHEEVLLDEVVWPMSLGVTLCDGDTGMSRVTKYKLQDSSRLNVPGGTIVVKEYSQLELEHAFKNEVSAYLALKNHRDPDEIDECFLKYFGSFEQGGKGYLLLEYADYGSLENFFTNNHPGSWDFAKLYAFWNGLTSLVQGLCILHNAAQNPKTRFRGIHQDMKPTNIFVFKMGDGFRFKIGDLGMCSTRLDSPNIPDAPDPDNQSTKMYGAPELTKPCPQMERIDNGVTAKVDIWSLGCLLAEAVVWSIEGNAGLIRFLADRQGETQHVPRLDLMGYSGTFHDGGKRLGVVDVALHRALSRKRDFDGFAGPLVGLILQHTLCEHHEDRADAYDLLRKYSTLVAAQSTAASQYPPQQQPWNNLSPAPSQQYTTTYVARQSSPAATAASAVSMSLGYVETNHPTSQFARYSPVSPDRARPIQPIFEDQLSDFDSPQSGTDPRTSYWSTHALGCGNAIPPPQRMSAPPTSGEEFKRDSLHLSSRPQSYSNPPISPQRERQHPAHGQQFASQSTPNQDRLAMGNHSMGTLVLDPTSSNLTNGMEHHHYEPEQPGNRNYYDEKRSGLFASRGPYEVEGTPPQRNNAQASTKAIGTSRDPAPIEEKYPMTTIEVVNKWIMQRKNKRSVAPSDLPGRTWTMATLKDREQIFVVDDSESMRSRHWNEVIDAFSALSYLVKGCDPNGIELCVTSNPKNIEKARKNASSKLVDFLNFWPQRSSPGDGNLERSLGDILDRIETTALAPSRFSSKTPPKVSIYVLTDGLWEGREVECGVDRPITRFISAIRTRLNQKHVSIQFIRFGRDPTAKRWLRYLDNDLGKKLDFDIVDHRSSRGNVWYMLLSSINTGADARESPSDCEDAEKEEKDTPSPSPRSNTSKGKGKLYYG